MKKYCYAYFNKLGDFYGQPFFVDHKEGFIDILRQNLFAAKRDDLEALKEDDLYFIGEFDNETGVFESKKDFLVSMSGLASEVLVKKFGEKVDGQA